MKPGDQVIVSLGGICELYGAHVVATGSKTDRVCVEYRDPRNGEFVTRWVNPDEVRKD
jgi:hypothetical protein|tara:strand:- start:3225 stop:3398 length:174 start_codon:yes stop_codon:yes gene_type:complete